MKYIIKIPKLDYQKYHDKTLDDIVHESYKNLLDSFNGNAVLVPDNIEVSYIPDSHRTIWRVDVGNMSAGKAAKYMSDFAARMQNFGKPGENLFTTKQVEIQALPE